MKVKNGQLVILITPVLTTFGVTDFKTFKTLGGLHCVFNIFNYLFSDFDATEETAELNCVFYAMTINLSKASLNIHFTFRNVPNIVLNTDEDFGSTQTAEF